MAAIRVIVPSWNCGEWIDRCLASLAMQTKQPESVLVVNDCSDEPGYLGLVQALCSEFDFGWMDLKTRRYCPQATRRGIECLAMPITGAKPDDVIVTLDGDDFLPPHALERIAEVYEDPEVWLTYGNYLPFPHNTGQTLASAFPPEVIKNRTFRTTPASHFNHLRTFRLFLYNALTDDDFKNDAGEWFTGSGDYVTMIPMIEMCGAQHYRFLDETLYYYNAVNPLSEVSVIMPRCLEVTQIKKRPIKPLLVR